MIRTSTEHVGRVVDREARPLPRRTRGCGKDTYLGNKIPRIGEGRGPQKDAGRLPCKQTTTFLDRLLPPRS